MAVRVPMLDAWGQFVWPPSAIVPWATTEVEQYGYHYGHAIDLGPVMPVIEFQVKDEEGMYLYAVRALIFEGSILVYNPTRDEVEWVPACSIANDLSWVQERLVVVLANFVPRTPYEMARIVGLGMRCLMGWLDDSSLQEEGNDDDQAEEGDDDGQVEEGDYGDGQAEGEGGDPEEEDPTDLEEQGEMGLVADPWR